MSAHIKTETRNDTDADDCFIVEADGVSGPEKRHHNEATLAKCTNQPACNRRQSGIEVTERHLSGEV